MIGGIRDPLLGVGGPISHWIRPETLVELTIEGRNINVLVDSGSQVNTIMPALVQQYGFSVLLLEDLVDYPLNLVETHLWRHISCDDHSAEGRRSTTGRQITSSGAPCSSCIHVP